MNRTILIPTVGLLALLGLAPVVRTGLLHARSEARLREYDPPAAFRGSLPTDAASVENGRRLVVTRGCSGCHGDDLAGRVLPWAGRAVAVNLTRYVREHDMAAFEAAVRHGIGADGRALVSMPSYMFLPMTDDDLLDIAACLHSLPVADDDLPEPMLDKQTRRALVDGTRLHVADYVKLVPPLRHQDDGADAALSLGEYIARTACTECHGLDLRGWVEEGWFAPDLAMAASYPEAEFAKLMHDGIALGNRELKTMSGVARARFSHFTDEERSSLHAFLRSLVHEPVSENVPWRVPPSTD